MYIQWLKRWIETGLQISKAISRSEGRLNWSTGKNDDELLKKFRALMEIWDEESKPLTGSVEQWRGAAVSLVSSRLMQRPGRGRGWGWWRWRSGEQVRRESWETRRRRRRMEGLFDPIYKEKDNRQVRESRRPKSNYPAAPTPRFSEWFLKIRIF